MADHRTAVSGPVFRRRVAVKLALALQFILFASASSGFGDSPSAALWTATRQKN